MQLNPIHLALFGAFAASPLMAATSVPAANPAVQAAPAQADTTPERWLERMTDFTRNGSAFKDPRVFTQWIGVMTDPNTAAAAMPVMIEPGTWIRTASSAMQPAAVSNYMDFADPNLYARWMGAMMDPNFYMQNMWSMGDPSKMMRWMMLPMDPRMMQSGIGMMNPNTYLKWMMAPADPRVWGMMFAPLNPQLYGSMAGAVINPAGLPSNWQRFMKPGQPVVNLSQPAPVTLPINALDPGSWSNMLNMFGGFFPMGGFQASGFPFFGGSNAYQQAPAAPRLAQAAPVAPAPAPAPFMQPGVPTRLNLSGDTLFKLGKSSIRDLTDEGKASLDKLAAEIKAAGAVDTIRIVGHADKTGKSTSNMALSQLRASSVAAYLKAQGVKAKKLITAGKGDTEPVVQCDAKLPKAELISCNQPNRRVEVEVTLARQ